MMNEEPLLEMGSLTLSDAPNQDEDGKKDEKKEVQSKELTEYLETTDKFYQKAEGLFQDIIDGKKPENFTDRYTAYKKHLVTSRRDQLQQHFAERLKRMGERWPCSPIWVALEMLLESKEKGEDKTDAKLYEQRREVLEFVAKNQQEFESLPLRRNHSSLCCWIVLGLCCLPCCCMLGKVSGKPIHYAAMRDNVDALKIFVPLEQAWHNKRCGPYCSGFSIIKCRDNNTAETFDYDGSGSPLHYAADCGNALAFAYLAEQEARLTTGWRRCDKSSYSSLSSDNPQIKRIILTTLKAIKGES